MTLRLLDRSRLEPEVGFLLNGWLEREVSSPGVPDLVDRPGQLRNPVAYLRTVRFLRRRIRETKPDVVLAWSAKVQLYLGVASLFTDPDHALSGGSN